MHNHASHKHYLHWLAANHLTKASCEISACLLRGFLFCGSQKLTYFYGGKRKYSVISTNLRYKKTVMETKISYIRGSENGNCQYDSHWHQKP